MTTTSPEFTVPTWWRQSAFLEFKKQYKQQSAPLFFIGSGLSIGAGLPNWTDLLLTLAQIHDDHSPATTALLPIISRRLQGGVTDHTQFLRAGTELETAFRDDIGPTAFRDAVNAMLNDETRLPKASRTHDAIARLRWSRIITTNYDVLLERAARASRRYPLITTHPDKDDFSGAEPAESQQRRILKIHGDIADLSSSLVLSTSSFERRYYGEDRDQYATVLQTVLRSSSVILFLGYGHNDPYIHSLFATLLNYAVVRRNVFALVPREGDPTQFALHLRHLTDQQIRVITYSPHAGHIELLQLLKYLADTGGHDQRYERLIRTRRPTVIMLHCGGTVGSVPTQSAGDAYDDRHVTIQESRYDSHLTAFSELLLRWYRASYNAGESLSIDILWEVMPSADQMFSENATYALWNALTTKIDAIIYKYFHAAANLDALEADQRMLELYENELHQYATTQRQTELTERMFRDDCTGRYILGIIVLFGTDTLAFTASALAMSIRHLPCPIILTGANQTPHDEGLSTLRTQFYSTSGAWTNLLNTIYFLQCFGHRLTEVFICFGNTVHNAFNLRKRAPELRPAEHRWHTSKFGEAFAFRNLSRRGQYMFRLIDGLFCNNYYPNPIGYGSLAQDSAFIELHHIRFHGVSRERPAYTLTESFLPRVTYVEVSPCFPLVDLHAMVDHGLFAVVAQGFPSGTYPSVPIHEFAYFLDNAGRLGVPVVLVARDGIPSSQQAYEVEDFAADHAAVLPLYEIIPETCLPLLALVTSRIPKQEWAHRDDETIDDVLARRKERLRAGIQSFLRERPGILSLELRNVSSKEDMYADMVTMQDLRNSQRKQRQVDVDELGWLWSIAAAPDVTSEPGTHRNVVLLARRDLLSIVDELPKTFETIEAGPDGLDAVFNLGFEYGSRLWRTCQEERDSGAQPESGDALGDRELSLFDLQRDIREQRLRDADEILATVRGAINSSGVAEVSVAALKIAERITIASAVRLASFTLLFHVPKFVAAKDRDERYAMMTFSDEERQFFERLSRGPDSGEHTHFDTDLGNRYKMLLRGTWSLTPLTMDWFVFGLCKGIAYGTATFLRIDEVVGAAETDFRTLQLFRRLMKPTILASGDHSWQIAYKYSELLRGDYEIMRDLLRERII